MAGFDIPHTAGRKTGNRRKPQVIAKPYPFHTNAKSRTDDSYLFQNLYSLKAAETITRINYKLNCIDDYLLLMSRISFNYVFLLNSA